MPGFGRGPFGRGGFGQWPWALETIVDGPPAVYQQTDEENGFPLRNLLTVVGQSLDESRRKIRDYDQLRDPFLAPTDQTFSETVQILQVDNLGDGTSTVFLGQGSNGDKFDNIRLGQTLQDFTSTRFEIVEIHQSELPSDFSTPVPTDPSTGLPTGKNIIISNISQGTQETIPMVSGTLVGNESPSSGQFASPGNVDDGTNTPPYIFTVADGPIAGNAVTITWTESAANKSGIFTNKGQPTGDLGVGSTINFSTGVIKIYTEDLQIIDAFSIRVSYTHLVSPPPEDGTVNSQHILAFLGQDFAVELDRHDPEAFQRSYVNHSFQLWDIKGSFDGYKYMGAIAGFYVQAFSLFRIDPAYIGLLPAADVFSFLIPQSDGTFAGPFPYTDMAPRRAVYDEVPADYIPTDLFNFEPSFPTLVQNITVVSATQIDTEGTNFRTKLLVTPDAGQMDRSLAFPRAVFVDSSGAIFDVDSYELVSSTQYSFQVLAPNVPVTGAGTISWDTIPLLATITTMSSPANGVIDFGPQYLGFTGHRIRIRLTLASPYAGDEALLAPVVTENWAVTFVDGTSAWVESMVYDSVTGLNVEVVTESIPTQGQDCYLYYVPNVVLECDWCAASVIRVVMTPDAILSDPAALAEDPGSRLTKRLAQMVPAHIRYAQFVYDPGPAIAAWDPAIMASSTVNSTDFLPVSFTPLFDGEVSWPADVISTPGTTPGGTGNGFDMMLATSDSTVTSPFVLEEHVDGTRPLLNGWTATGLWKVSTHRPAGESALLAAGLKPSGSALFMYGTVDPNTPFQSRLDLNGEPNSGFLQSPTIAKIVTATTITVEFWHYCYVGSGMTNFLVSLEIRDATSNVVLQTFDKHALDSIDTTGWTVRSGSGYSTPPQWVHQVCDITTAVENVDPFYLRFNFDTVTSSISSAFEGWYIDDIVVRVTP
jgi:hypothetical protein